MFLSFFGDIWRTLWGLLTTAATEQRSRGPGRRGLVLLLKYCLFYYGLGSRSIVLLDRFHTSVAWRARGLFSYILVLLEYECRVACTTCGLESRDIILLNTSYASVALIASGLESRDF